MFCLWNFETYIRLWIDINKVKFLPDSSVLKEPLTARLVSSAKTTLGLVSICWLEMPCDIFLLFFVLPVKREHGNNWLNDQNKNKHQLMLLDSGQAEDKTSVLIMVSWMFLICWLVYHWQVQRFPHQTGSSPTLAYYQKSPGGRGRSKNLHF